LISNVILVLAAVTTIWLVYYVQIYLPRQLEQRFLESMKAFSRAIELRFPANTGATLQVIEISKAIGRRFSYTRSELHTLELAAHLRDIGCCAMPYHPFNDKPRTTWTENETKVFAKHPEVSWAMLELVPSLRHVALDVRWHDARFDGQNSVGCPVGPFLPLNARILKVSSDFVVLEQRIGSGAAKQEIESRAGTEYCPDVVSEFVQVLTSSRVHKREPSLA
jgi:response regulator RpfG family c-di-GMP phosphodiesterase